MPQTTFLHGFRLGDRLSSWRQRRRLRRELCALSDRQLDDLGISRDDISRVVMDLPPV